MRPVLRVLARGRRWAVVAKPGGVACHRSGMVRDRDTLVRRARRRFGANLHLVHRLDRATSGCLVVAFDPVAAADLHDALRDPSTTKTYLALVRGFWKWDDPFTIDAPMKDDQGAWREASTVADVLGRSMAPRVSLVRARPRTGRFHQVRRHLRDVDHPVLGDSMHGDTRANRVWREQHGLPRLGLHCAALDMPDPDGGRIRVRCPVPLDLGQVLHAQPWWPDAVAAAPDLLTAPPMHLGPPAVR